eukprot:86064-Prymnesium_polylepis.1
MHLATEQHLHHEEHPASRGQGGGSSRPSEHAQQRRSVRQTSSRRAPRGRVGSAKGGSPVAAPVVDHLKERDTVGVVEALHHGDLAHERLHQGCGGRARASVGAVRALRAHLHVLRAPEGLLCGARENELALSSLPRWLRSAFLSIDLSSALIATSLPHASTANPTQTPLT